jgi:hypothetical protein
MGDRLISACGLECSDCAAYIATQKDDAKAVSAVAAKWSQLFDASVADDAVWCDGCMTGRDRLCANAEECDVRACVRKRGLDTCAACGDYACDKLEQLLAVVGPGARETLESLRA